MSNSKIVNVRVGELWKPMEAWCEKHLTTPSEFLRAAIAEKLGVTPPILKVGGLRSAPMTESKEAKE